MALCCSPDESSPPVAHNEFDDGFGVHNWLPPGAHVSDGPEALAEVTGGLEPVPRRPQPAVDPAGVGACC